MNSAQLEKFRKKLLEKRRELLKGVQTSSSSSMETGSDGIQDIADQASSAYTKEFLLSVGDEERRVLKQIEIALQKIKEGIYGQCEACKSPISLKRLEAIPFAQLCISCKEKEEKGVVIR
ncbi:MAG: TraR/DksA family transcriptional regulator [candidate division NC10 bacterium]|nr:TraR/DksA family transcriptional regulator [candidate division NC10 bacterium]